MTSTVAIGDLGNVETLKYIKIGTKAAGGGKAIAAGKLAFLTESSGVWAITPASANTVGPFGVVPRLYPANVDADTAFAIVTGGGEMYVKADGAIKPGSRVQASASTAGEVVAYVPAAITATPDEAETELAAEAYNRVVGVYLGHTGEGSGLAAPATDAADGEVIRIALGGGGL